MRRQRKPEFTEIFKHFLHSEKTGGLILIFCTVVSILVANSPAANDYLHFWHSKLALNVQSVHLDFSLEDWINEGLMTIFFLMIGLEIERELYVGELKNINHAILPIMAAVGGMVVPALIHFGLNHGSPTQAGMGIPMATDIAFSLGLLSLLGTKSPPALKIFLTALAIIDDLGAVIVIAIFYTREFSLMHLSIALGIFMFMIILNRLNVFIIWIYLLLGIFMWYFMLKSGVHATVSGVMLAFAIPFRKNWVDHPSSRLQKFLHQPVNLLIIPFFALANTGIQLSSGWVAQLKSPNSLGIIFGLFLGKPIGIYCFCLLAVSMKWCRLPVGIQWKVLLSAGILAGIGYTMSIFISNLAFGESGTLVEQSKIAVVFGSLLSGILGLFALKWTLRKSA
ncbi:MAG: Na+/H+ antiporter NhaA [Chitinophagales bacterium]